MKLFSYLDGDIRTGVMSPDLQFGYDIPSLLAAFHKRDFSHLNAMQNIVEAGEDALQPIREALEDARRNPEKYERMLPQDIEWRAPLPMPVKLRCFSVYEKHMRQSIDAFLTAKGGKWLAAFNRVMPVFKIPKAFYAFPFYYKGNPTSVIGHQQQIEWPTFDEDKMDYELELAVIIGKAGIDISAARAMDHVFGYTCFNDVSARGRLIEEMLKLKAGLLKAKDFHTGNAMGPWIVTADEIADPQSLSMKVSVNGELRGEAHTADMYWSVREQIAFASEGEMLVPGEVFATGAAGDGCGIEQWRFLDPEDEVTLEIEGIGKLTNRLVKTTA